MNKRVIEILEETMRGHTFEPTTAGLVEFAAKFAETIVKECADMIDNKVMITAAQTYDEVFVTRYDTKELCAKQIREHFGVNE